MISTLALVIFVYGILYGGVMGTYGGVAGPRFWQVAYSAVKVPFLLLATFAISLPSFFVINTLLGLRTDFPYVVRALLSTQAGLTVILSALAPFTAFWYISGSALRACDSVQRGHVRRGELERAVDAAPQLRAACAQQRAAPVDAARLVDHLRLRRYPDGLGAAAVHREPRGARAVFPGGKLDQRLRSRAPDDLGCCERPRETVSFVLTLHTRH